MSDFLKKLIVLLIFFLFILSFISYFFFVEKMNFSMPVIEPAVKTEQVDASLKSMDFSKINQEFLFSAQIPGNFNAEYIPQLKAINVYQPILPGQNNAEKSQIYITYFKSDRFLTLGNVEITQRDSMIIKGREAVLYEITKKPSVSNFSGQPSWRNFKHKAVDIRFSKTSPSQFYSFAYDPNLSEKIFNDFINSLVFYNQK